MQQAIEYETRWQIETLEDGGSIHQATVLFDPDTGETRAMRSKEEANDYRYFPDPDLLPLVISEEDIAEVKSQMPQLPDEMQAELEVTYGLSTYDAATLTSSIARAIYFKDLVARLSQLSNKDISDCAKIASSWLNGEFASALNASDVSILKFGLSPAWLATLLIRILDGTISRSGAKAIWPGMLAVASAYREAKSDNQIAPDDKQEFHIDALIDELGLKQVSDSGAIEAIVDEVLAANAAMVAEFKAGKEKAFNGLVGQCMKASKGKANPAQVNDILRKKLS
jgi:aspartyl-tRNA(Asn)/glutamyl-tRNA(Gln) amidotransferase subunit B